MQLCFFFVLALSLLLLVLVLFVLFVLFVSSLFFSSASASSSSSVPTNVDFDRARGRARALRLCGEERTCACTHSPQRHRPHGRTQPRTVERLAENACMACRVFSKDGCLEMAHDDSAMQYVRKG